MVLSGHYKNEQEAVWAFADGQIWAYSGNKTILYSGHSKLGGKIPVSNGLSKTISKDLKKRGFKYVGEVTIYSHLQACGIINDHDETCPCYERINAANPTVNKRKDMEVY